MKCPECQATRKYRDGMQCACGYQFVLNPKSDKFSDGKLWAVIRQASANDTYYFTENQLYTAYCRKQYTSPMTFAVAGGAALGLGGGLLLVGLWRTPATWVIGAGVLLFAIAAILKYSPPPTRDKFLRLVRRYEDAKGPLNKLLRTAALQEPPPAWPEPDLYDYGVERLLVVQHDLLVDLLVRNEFHTAQRTLVISGKGYPDYIVQRAATASAENPQLPVHFLHDATEAGIAWAETVGGSDRLPWHEHPRLDLGLFPADVQRIKRLAPLKPSRMNYALAVDALPYAQLSAGLASALEQQVTLGALLASRGASDADAVLSFG